MLLTICFISDNVFSSITTACLTENGLVAAGDTDGLVMLWEPRKSDVIELGFHDDTITSVHCQGGLLASSDVGNTVRLWDLKRSRELNSWVQKSTVNKVIISPNGQSIFGSMDGMLSMMIVEDTSGKVITRVLEDWNNPNVDMLVASCNTLTLGTYCGTKAFCRKINMFPMGGWEKQNLSAQMGMQKPWGEVQLLDRMYEDEQEAARCIPKPCHEMPRGS